MRRGEEEGAVSNLKEAILVLDGVGYCRYLWEAQASLGRAFDQAGRISEAGEQWGAAAATIKGVADGLSDSQLREGFLNAQPVREILAK